MIRSQTGTPFNGRGRIEVCANNQWGTVCDDGWGTNDAKVACAQLGFSRNSTDHSYCIAIIITLDAARYLSAAFGTGYGSIIMHHLTCSSNENSLFSCGLTLGSAGCSHSEDAGARCAGMPSHYKTAIIFPCRSYNN